jgi:uncharacterized protein
MNAFSGHRPAIGLAYSSYVDELVVDDPDSIDFVEMPFELLRANPATAKIGQRKPTILHCASLSMAGGAVSPAMWQCVGDWITRTATPWLGEHLAFVSATAVRGGDPILVDDQGEAALDVGYAVGPCMNDDVVATVVDRFEETKARYPVQTILENAPVYFDVPGSTMSQPEFVGEICARCSTSLLIDLSHLFITAHKMKADPIELMLTYPLDRVVEVHISGVDAENGGAGAMWDDHTVRAPKIVHEMLSRLLPLSPVRAVTLEYNWSVNFPRAVLLDEIARVRSVVTAAA